MARDTLADHDVSEDALSGPVVDRRTTLSLLATAGLTGLAGCSGGDDGGDDGSPDTDQPGGTSDATESTAGSQDAVQPGGTLEAAWPVNELTSLDPPAMVGQPMALCPNIFSGLVKLGPDINIVGDLASDWEVTNDGKTYTFQLREGVEFHNGDPLTPEDIQFTLDRSINEFDSWRIAPLKSPYDGGVEIVSDTEIKLNFEIPYAPALIYLTAAPARMGAVVSEAAINDMGQEEYAITPVGTGPFEVVEHNTGSQLTLEAYDNYFMEDENGNQLPYLDTVNVSMVPEDETRVNGLRTGEIDFTDAFPYSSASQLEGMADVEERVQTGATIVGLMFNCAQEPFDDPEVRRAVAKLIDREQFIQDAYFGYATPGLGPLNPFNEWAYREDKPDDQAYAPEEGRAILEDKGIDDLSFELYTSQFNQRQNEVLQLTFQDMGFDVTLNNATTGTFWSNIYGQEYTAAGMVNVTAFDPQNDTWNLFRKPDEGGRFNVCGYVEENANHANEVHEKLGQTRETVDREARKELFWEVEDMLIEDAPWAFLGHFDNLSAHRSTVRNLNEVTYVEDLSKTWVEQ
jgi:peptide/nickel transport system substrate-binding protein